MDRIALFAGVVCFSLTLFARAPLPPEEAAAIIQQFQYPAEYQELQSRLDGGSWDSCWFYDKVISTQHPNLSDETQVALRLYIPNRQRLGNKQVPAVIMLPPIGGINFLDRQMAETFCDRGIAAIVVANDFANIQAQANGALLPPEDHQNTFYRVGAGVKAVMKLSQEDANIDANQIGMFGVSLGGILGAFVMATQPEFSAGYFIVAGGDIPNILAHSEQDEVARIRRKRMQEQGFQDRQSYEEFLRAHVLYDPIDLALTMVPETLQMVIAQYDDSVPTDNQLALFEAFGQPEAQYHYSGHVDTVIGALLFGEDRRRVARFFEKRFKEVNPRPASFQFMESLELAQSW